MITYRVVDRENVGSSDIDFCKEGFLYSGSAIQVFDANNNKLLVEIFQDEKDHFRLWISPSISLEQNWKNLFLFSVDRSTEKYYEDQV